MCVCVCVSYLLNNTLFCNATLLKYVLGFTERALCGTFPSEGDGARTHRPDPYTYLDLYTHMHNMESRSVHQQCIFVFLNTKC